MIGLGAVTKLMRGGIGADDLAELLAAVGVEMELEHIEESGRGPAFNRAAVSSLLVGAKTVALHGKLKSGERVEAVLVVSPASV